jgi:hypothetical protein
MPFFVVVATTSGVWAPVPAANEDEAANKFAAAHPECDRNLTCFVAERDPETAFWQANICGADVPFGAGAQARMNEAEANVS